MCLHGITEHRVRIRYSEVIDLDLSGFDVLAELAIGLAGFSGVLIVLIKPSGGFSPPEHVRLINLVYSSLGVTFLAILPYGFSGIGFDSSTSWRIVGLIGSLYTVGGLLFIPIRVLMLRKDFPDLFPWRLFFVQTLLHTAASILCVLVLLDLSSTPSRLYFFALFLLLVHAAIVYVRILLFRRD